jgi:hypothetical protein
MPQRRFVWWGHGVNPEATVKIDEQGPGLETFRQNPAVFGFLINHAR